MQVSTHGKALLHNIAASVMVCNVLATCLGPRGCSKLIVKPDGSVIVSNSGNTIIQNIDIHAHPAAKLIADIASSQDKEVGDGVISFMVMTKEMLCAVESAVTDGKIHIGTVIGSMQIVSQRVNQMLGELSIPLIANSDKEILSILENLAWTAISTKFAQSWGKHLVSLAASSVVSLGDFNLDLLKVMRLPGGNVSDSMAVAGVMVSGSILRAPPQLRYPPHIILADFALEGAPSVATNISKASDVDIWHQEDGKWAVFMEQLVKLNISVLFSTQNCEAKVNLFAQYNIGVVHLVEASDMTMLAQCARCRILSEPTDLLSLNDSYKPSNLPSPSNTGMNDKDKHAYPIYASPPIAQEDDVPLLGTVGGIEVTDRSSRFVLVRNREDAKYGPRTILLRGGSGEVLAEASRGLKTAIAVVKCALSNSTRLPLPSEPPHTSTTNVPYTTPSPSSPTTSSSPTVAPLSIDEPFVPRSISVVLGGGCIEMAIASKLRAEYKSGNKHFVAAQVFAKSLEGFVNQLATNSGITAPMRTQLLMAHQRTPFPSHPLPHASRLHLPHLSLPPLPSHPPVPSHPSRPVPHLSHSPPNGSQPSEVSSHSSPSSSTLPEHVSMTNSFPYLGIDGRNGVLADMTTMNLFTPTPVVATTLTNAITAVSSILRVDAIISVPLAKPLLHPLPPL